MDAIVLYVVFALSDFTLRALLRHLALQSMFGRDESCTFEVGQFSHNFVLQSVSK